MTGRCSVATKIRRYNQPDYGLREKKKIDRGDDTIAAIITPPGEGGIAAIRLAGPNSRTILNSLFRPESPQDADPKPFMLRYGAFHGIGGGFIDEVTSVYMPHGKSYTGLEQVEIFCHGGRQVVRTILDEVLAQGARMAEPGAFTRLAFLNGKIDLARAEAVAEIIAANTEQSLQASKHHLTGAYSDRIAELRAQLLAIRAEVEASIDFVEEDIDPADSAKLIAPMERLLDAIRGLAATYTGGRIINEGYKVVIGGRPNAGKSSLFNVLLRQERALVNPEAGTTRDYLSEWIDLEGFAVNLIDTAGLRAGGDSVEREGQNRAKERMTDSDLIVWMADITEPDWEKHLKADLDELPRIDTLVVGNKTDLLKKIGEQTDPSVLYVSCRTGEGVEKLTEMLVARINAKMPDLTDGLVVTSARHRQKLDMAAKAVETALTNSKAGETPELIAFDLKEATEAIDEITGHVYTEEILGKIFSTFCIGK